MRIGRENRHLGNPYLVVLLAIFGVAALVYGINRGYQSIRTKPNLETSTPAKVLKITIKRKAFNQLASFRKKGLEAGVLTPAEKVYVPATIEADQKTLPAKVRLKGDLTDHFDGKRWSLRIRLRDGGAIWGLKKFSIQDPKTRKFLGEWLIQRALKYFGLFYLRLEFVKVILNGQDMGYYALEEHFDDALIANNRLREGLIVYYDENDHWERGQRYEKLIDRSGDILEPATILAYDFNKVLNNPTLKKQFEHAQNIIHSLQKGDRKLSEVFSVAPMAKYLALVDLLGGQHSLLFTNMRFYYDPLAAQFEYVGFDHDGLNRIERLSGEVFADIKNRLPGYGTGIVHFWQDNELATAYLAELEKVVSDDAFLKPFFDSIEKEIVRDLDKLLQNDSNYRPPLEIIRMNAEHIKAKLNPVRALVAYRGKTVRAFKIGNVHSLPIRLLRVEHNGKTILEPNKLLMPRVRFGLASFEDLQLPVAIPTEESSSLVFFYRILGTQNELTAPVFNWKAPSVVSEKSLPKSSIRKEKLNFPFLKVDRKQKTITVVKENVLLDSSLVIPPGYQLIVPEGTRIEILKQGHILSFGAVHFLGSAESPILVTGRNDGNGIAVIEAKSTSIIRNTTFQDLSVIDIDGIGNTGAVSFYKSDVRLENTNSIRTKSEDAINIVSSKFTIENLTIKSSSFDALDIDFGQGTITNSKFIDIGNDAIDVSGTEAFLQGITVKSAKDKAISIGEDSKVDLKNGDFQDIAVGLAAKDLSKLTVRNITLSKGKVGVAVYTKKQEFGPALINASEIKFVDFLIPILIEPDSMYTEDNLLVGHVLDETSKNFLAKLKAGETL